MSNPIYKIYGANDTWIATEPHDLWKSEPFIEKSAYDALKAENEKLRANLAEGIELVSSISIIEGLNKQEREWLESACKVLGEKK